MRFQKDRQNCVFWEGNMKVGDCLATLKSAAAVWALCASGALAQTNIEFIQWWEPEMPAGALRGIMDEFEAANPDIKVTLVSGPYATTRDQIVVGAASGTLSDVVGLDGAWVNGLAKQGAIASMDELMAAANYDPSQIADIVKADGKSVMFPLASFIYPVFVNLDLAKAAGVETIPGNRTEFAEAAKKMTNPDKNEYGWVLPLSLQNPGGIQNDVMSWVWASGGSMLKDGQPDLENADVISALEYIKSLNDAGVISPGIFAKKEQDKVEEFVNGRVGMMVSSLAHINLIRERNLQPVIEADTAGAADIIARRGDLVIFVEVKARRDLRAGVDAVGYKAERRIANAADHWLRRQSDATRLSLRHDIIVVRPWRWPAHFESAF